MRSAKLNISPKKEEHVIDQSSENPLLDVMNQAGPDQGQAAGPDSLAKVDASTEEEEDSKKSKGGILDEVGSDPTEQKEAWEPSQYNTGGTWEVGETMWTFDEFQDEMAKQNVVGSNYLSSVFDTYLKKVANMLFHSAMEGLNRTEHAYQLYQLNMIVDKKFVIHFISSKAVDPGKTRVGSGCLFTCAPCPRLGLSKRGGVQGAKGLFDGDTCAADIGGPRASFSLLKDATRR